MNNKFNTSGSPQEGREVSHSSTLRKGFHGALITLTLLTQIPWAEANYGRPALPAIESQSGPNFLHGQSDILSYFTISQLTLEQQEAYTKVSKSDYKFIEAYIDAFLSDMSTDPYKTQESEDFISEVFDRQEACSKQLWDLRFDPDKHKKTENQCKEQALNLIIQIFNFLNNYSLENRK